MEYNGNILGSVVVSSVGEKILEELLDGKVLRLFIVCAHAVLPNGEVSTYGEPLALFEQS